MERLIIEPKTEAVRELAARALEECSNAKPSLTLRCDKGCKIAAVGRTSFGTLFTSSWEVSQQRGHVIVVNGRELTAGRAARFERNRGGAAVSGRPVVEPERHGATAILEQEADLPALLMACKHGSALANAREILEHLPRARGKRNVRTVKVSPEHPDYQRPTLAGAARSISSRSVQKIAGEAMTLDEAREWLGWSDTPEVE